MNTFYLKGDCLNPPGVWRKCTVVSEHTILETNAKMYLVEVDPPFESSLYDEKMFDHVLLGMTTPKWDLARIGDPHFMVDILHAKESSIDRDINMSSLKRLGMGMLSGIKN